MFEEFIGVNFWTALAVLVNTLLTYAVGRRYLFEPVKKLMDSRQREIDEMYARAEEAEGRARTLEEEYRRKLSAAEAASERLMEEAAARGRSREADIVRAASAEASAILARGEADLAREKKKVLCEVKEEILGLAVGMAEQVLGRELSRVAREELADGFLDRLGEPG